MRKMAEEERRRIRALGVGRLVGLLSFFQAFAMESGIGILGEGFSGKVWEFSGKIWRLEQLDLEWSVECISVLVVLGWDLDKT